MEDIKRYIIAKDIAYLDHNNFDIIASKTVAVSKLLNGLLKKTKSISRNS